MGIEALAFCSLLVVILILGGLVSLFEAITTTIPPQANPSRTALQQVNYLRELIINVQNFQLTVMLVSNEAFVLFDN